MEAIKTKIKYCIDCHKAICSKSTARCLLCNNKYQSGIRHPGYIDGRTKAIKYCKDCSKKLSLAKYTYCKKCSTKLYSGKNHYQFGKLSKHGQIIKYKNYMMRSTWEAIFAKFLDDNNIKWQYESKTFNLINATYTPDFYLPDINMYIEIKGWWRDDAKYKFELFKIFYPDIKIQILSQKEFRELKLLKLYKDNFINAKI